MENLKKLKYEILPIMSEMAYSTDTRFGKAQDFIKKIEKISEKKIINSRCEAEPIGPQNMADILLIAPCTSNTLAKLANAITDTSVTMAVKSHLRKNRPVLIALASNDALSSSAKNLGKMLNIKNIFFVPISQDDYKNKPNSLVADFKKIPSSLKLALKNKQAQPIFY